MFGQRVKQLRVERFLTQAELAERAGVTRETISNYERGERLDPPLSIVWAIANALDVEVAVLVNGPDPKVAATSQ